jgi:hypothetical protein
MIWRHYQVKDPQDRDDQIFSIMHRFKAHEYFWYTVKRPRLIGKFPPDQRDVS